LAQTTFDLGYLNSLTSVRLDGGITAAQALNGFDSGESLDLRAALSDVLTVGVNNASTGTADAFTATLGASANTDYTDLSIANVETLTINNTEATANTLVRANTIGLALSQATGGAAQSVIITGTEALTIDTAIAAATINASGMTVGVATDEGLTMGVAFTATSAIAGQTITGSGKVDVLRSSTGADNINAGAGNDSIHGSVGADTIDGGAGTDIYITASTMVAANIEGAGTGTSTGVVINLGATALTNANVLANTLQNLSSSMTSVASGQVAYLFNNVAPTNSSVVKTLSNIENVTLEGNGINYVVGSDAANVIVGGSGVDTINAGAGADTITSGAGNDYIDLTETTAAIDKVVFAGGATNAATLTANGLDRIIGFGATDTINVSALGSGSQAAVTATVSAASTIAAFADAGTYILNVAGTAAALTTNGTAVVTDFTDMTQVSAFLSERYSHTTTTADLEAVFIWNVGTTTYVYNVDTLNAVDTVIAANEISLVGQITQGAALTAANIVFA
jgi:Ca2+-binding RTX toxin-like protein